MSWESAIREELSICRDVIKQLRVDIASEKEKLEALENWLSPETVRDYYIPLPEIVGYENRIRELESQLPKGMEHCTIVFKECSVGHGWLTANNWLQHECQQCEIVALKNALEFAKK